MTPRNILVVEDDPHIRRGLADALASEGYTVTHAPDGAAALHAIHHAPPDLILLDIMMPQKSGYDVCRDLRRQGSTIPIIMLTAKSEEIDKVVGLQLGADDYITKPFGIHELLARVAAVLRRANPPAPPHPPQLPPPDRYPFGDAQINRKTHTLQRGKQTFSLTARELKLLDTFHAHPNEVLSRDTLLNRVWGIDYYGTTRTLDQHIAQLRKKVETDPSHPRHLLTVHGVGYRYRPSPQS
ncbi:MAG TPA: response regulator transcription factor [Kiritimatiellia bacterium]|nr:response regulator transcription factor [Kiritimatiellia bacterium]